MSRLLSEASESELVAALSDRLPKALFGHPVDQYSLVLRAGDTRPEWRVLLQLPEGRSACGLSGSCTAHMSRHLAEPGAHWCVFNGHELEKSGGIEIFPAKNNE